MPGSSVVRSAFREVASMNIHVEPLVFIFAACMSAKQVLMPQLSQEKMERVYDPPANLSGLALEKFYNKQMVRWDQYHDYINIPVACVLGIFYGAYSDRAGRKIPMLIGLSSMAVDLGIRMLVFGKGVDLPLYFTLIAAALSGLMGEFFLFMSAVNAYVADLFPVKRTLSMRMIVVSVLFSVGSLVGSLVTKYLAKVISPMSIFAIVQALVLLSVLFCIFVVEQRKPVSKRLILEEEEAGFSIARTGQLSISSFFEAIKIFVVDREGHRRCFLFVAIIAVFLDQLVFGEEKSLIGTYTRLSPFSWGTGEYATYKTVRPIVQIVGMLFGLVVLKRVCCLRDTLLILLSIVSMTACVLCIGLARSSWLIYASVGLGSLHGLLNPLSYTFVSCLVQPDEVGKAFAVNSVVGKLALIAQSLVLQNIYRATVDWYQGFVWLLMAGLAAVAALLFTFIHFLAGKEEIGS